MTSKIGDLFVKLGQLESLDKQYLITTLKLLNEQHEEKLTVYRKEREKYEKRNDKYEIKQCNWHINLYEGMIKKNNIIIDKLTNKEESQ